jgi:DNA repair exonuclease SbcCD ATPase subunit
MGKITDQILSRILKMRELSVDAINELTARIRKSMIEQDGKFVLHWDDMSNLTLYLDSLKDTTEALEEEIEMVGGAKGDARRAQRALERENQALMDKLADTQDELAHAKLNIEILAELNAQLFKLCEEREKMTVMTQMRLQRWRDHFYPTVVLSKKVENQWELVVANYTLETFTSYEEANKVLDLLLAGISLV